MIELSELYRKMLVGSMYPRKLIKILSNTDSIYVKTWIGGQILLSNGSVLECVSNYYELPKNMKKLNNRILPFRCQKVRKALEIENEISPLCCIRCHLLCADMELNGQITRKGKGVYLS